MANLTLEGQGATLHRGTALSILPELVVIADAQPAGRAGIRLHGVTALRRHLANDGTLGAIAAAELGPRCHPVRAIMFDKTREANWALGWHQDRTIVVRERHEAPGFGAWTVKSGLLHVAPPADLLAAMLTMRVHLDAVPATNAPLIIAPGSHRLGRIREGDVDTVVANCGTFACIADAGDVWLYATLIVHASDASEIAMRRRVLQIDFAATDLPGELEWLGIW